MAEVGRHRRHQHVHPFAPKRVDNVREVVLVVAIDTSHARVIMRDAVIGEHLHAFPLELLHCIGRPDLQDESAQCLPESRALEGLESPDHVDVGQEVLVERAGTIRSDNLVVAHQDDGKVGRVLRQRFRDRVHDVGIDRRHGQVDDLDASRRERRPELRFQQAIETVVLVGETQRRRSSEDEHPDRIGIAFPGERVFERADIQRRRVELVGEFRVLLVVGLTIDVDFMEIVERRSDASNREPELEQDEEEQRYDNDRNEREGNFSYVGHGVLTSEFLERVRVAKHSVVRRHPVVRYACPLACRLSSEN